MRTVTPAFQNELDKDHGAQPRKLLEVDAVGSTLYYSNQPVLMPGDREAWTVRKSTFDNDWQSVAYGAGLFVAVSETGTGNRVMTSPDGINWTPRASAADNQWRSVVYGNGLFVAVSLTGSSNRVMTSPDGINWTSRTSTPNKQWVSVTYGDGLFVAVAITGTGDRVMTSPDGINWTSRTSAADNSWRSVTFGNGLFVAVAISGTGDRVMTSPDGINWTSRTSAADNSWRSVIYNVGLFVAVASSGTGNRVMTSPDGINWTSRTSAADRGWYSVTYGDGLFVAVDTIGTENKVMTSPDGINWEIQASSPDNQWRSVTYSADRFVAVAITGTDDRVMTSLTRTYSSKVLSFGNLTSQIVPGENAVRVASMGFRLSNIEYIDDLVIAGTVVRVYDWFEGLGVADKSLAFKGTIVGQPKWDDLEISFRCNDIFQKFNKIVGRPLLAADWAKVDPDYLGRTIPILIGDGKNLECLPIEAGAASTLREEFTPSDTIIKLTNTEEPMVFPSSGTVIIGTVEYAYSGKSSNNLTGVPNPAITHPQGSVVLEKTNLKYLAGESFSDTPVKAITNLRILPFNSRKVAEAVAIDSAFYTIDLTETISGDVYATVVLTQIAAIRKAVSFAITQQPDQPITTQQTQLSPNHGHTPSDVTTTVNLQDTNLISQAGAQTRANWEFVSYLVDANHNSKGRWTADAGGANCTIRCRRVSGFEENGTPVQLRFHISNTLSGGSGTAKLYINSVFKQTITLPTNTSNWFAISSWGDVSGGGTYVEIYTTGNAGNYVEVREVWFDVQYTPANPNTAVSVNQNVAAVSNRITDVAVGGDTVAATLLGTVICDYEGFQDKSDGHYTGTPNVLIEDPPDVEHFLWENFSNGAVHADLDIAGSFLDARTNLPGSYKFGFALTWQVELDKLSAQLAQQAHCRFFTSAGLGKFARILTSGTPVKTIDTDDYSPLTEGPEKKLRVERFGGAIEGIINKVEIRYKHNPVLGPRGNPDAYADNTEDFNQASIDAYGERKPRVPWLMWAVRDDTMADDLRDKLLARNKDPKITTIFPSWATLALLEPSDLIQLTSSPLRIAASLSELLQIGNNPQLPKDKQPTEIMLTVREL